MSKAKAILQRIVDGDNRGDFFISNALLKEIEVALAEPEPEPVAWMYEWYENDLESTQAYCGSEKPFKGEIVQPFNFRPLYTAPPKQEPLSNEEILVGFPQGVHITTLAFYEGVKFAEKMHGIGGGE
jgi:hypothetical protein